MANPIPWVDERNRNKLIDAMQRGQFPTFVGVLDGQGMGGTIWTVPSDIEASEQAVVLEATADGQRAEQKFRLVITDPHNP